MGDAVPAAVVDTIVAMRRCHPRWGPRKLLAVLRRQETNRPWPVASTVGDILRQRAWFAADVVVATACRMPSAATSETTGATSAVGLDARGQVDVVADDRVIHAGLGADVSGDHLAGVDTDATLDAGELGPGRPPGALELGEALLHADAGA